jgi:hypothetical protein
MVRGVVAQVKVVSHTLAAVVEEEDLHPLLVQVVQE